MANQESSVPSIIIDTQPYLPDLHLISRGKVRDIYTTSNPDALLFVASDRISAHDVIMKNVFVSVYLCLNQKTNHLSGLLCTSQLLTLLDLITLPSKCREYPERERLLQGFRSSGSIFSKNMSQIISLRQTSTKCQRRCTSTSTYSKDDRCL